MSKILRFVMIGVLLISCRSEIELQEVPYLNIDSSYITADGEGDGFLLSIRTNLAWTAAAEDENGAEVDWIRLTVNSGQGDADVIGIVLQGSRGDSRSCMLVVRSEDGTLVSQVPFSQEKFVPILQPILMSSLFATASRMPLDSSEPLLDFRSIEALVTAVPSDNIPGKYIYLTDDGTLFIKASVPDPTGIKAGDKVKLETTEGTLVRGADGSITLELSTPMEVLSSENPLPVANIQASALQRYENAFVCVRSCQVQDGSLGKNWGGTTSMVTDDSDRYTFDVVVSDNASFAGTAVSSDNGTVMGIVVDGKLRPRSMADINLTESQRDTYKAPYTIIPVRAFYKMGAKANTFTNGSASGNTKFTFSELKDYSDAGVAFEKVVGSNNKLALNGALNTPFNTCCTIRQWHLEGTYMTYTVPVKQKIYGDLEFSFSISCGKAEVFADRTWSAYWSTDNESWKKVDGVYGASNNKPGSGDNGDFSFAGTDLAVNRIVLEVSIPENEALTSGNIYFKLVPPAVDASYSNNTVRVNVGCYLTSATPFPEEVDYHNIVARETFNDALNGINPVVGFPVYYMAWTSKKDDYFGKCNVTGTNKKYRGCLLLSASSGENYISAPALNITGTTDLILTFKAAPYVDCAKKTPVISQNCISVSCSGEAVAGEVVWDNPDFASDPYNWHTATVKITGATPNTLINIGNLSSDISGASFYIDDIVVSK